MRCARHKAQNPSRAKNRGRGRVARRDGRPMDAFSALPATTSPEKALKKCSRWQARIDKHIFLSGSDVRLLTSPTYSVSRRSTPDQVSTASFGAIFGLEQVHTFRQKSSPHERQQSLIAIFFHPTMVPIVSRLVTEFYCQSRPYQCALLVFVLVLGGKTGPNFAQDLVTKGPADAARGLGSAFFFSHGMVSIE